MFKRIFLWPGKSAFSRVRKPLRWIFLAIGIFSLVWAGFYSYFGIAHLTGRVVLSNPQTAWGYVGYFLVGAGALLFGWSKLKNAKKTT